MNLKQLLVLSQKGDQVAYHRFLLNILKIITQRVNKKLFNQNDTKDVTQEVLISIHKSLASYDSKREVMPWVMAITDRRIIDYIRKITRKNEFENLSFDGDVTKLADDTNNNTEDLDSYHMTPEIQELLNTLPEQAKRAIELTKLEGYSTKEAAQVLGLKENALRTKISRGLASLRDRVKQEK
jgi:RNA polymerase sigma-70 factor (ECF subfamily)